MTSSTSSDLASSVSQLVRAFAVCIFSFLIAISSSYADEEKLPEGIKKQDELKTKQDKMNTKHDGMKIEEKSILNKIKTEGVLKVCSEPGYLPLEMKTASGKWLGFDVKMVEAYAKSLNVKLKMIDVKWDGIIPFLKTSRCDLIASSMAETEDRKKSVSFSDPYYHNKFLIAVRDNKQNREKFKKLSDFKHKDIKVAVKTGSAPDIYLKNNDFLFEEQVMRFDADADTVGAVLTGRARAFIYDTPYVKLAALKNPNQIYILPEGFNGDHFAVAFRKEDEELVENFNSFLKDWKKSGEYEKTMEYYFEGQDWMPLLEK